RGEDVDTAHDQHVVGSADAADPRAGAAAGARARPHLDVVTGAEAQKRRGAVPQMAQNELAARAVDELDRIARLRVAQLRADEAAGAEVHPVLLLALAPERDADVADAHRLGHPRAPAFLESRPERRLAAAGLAGYQHPLDARARQVEASLCCPLDDVDGIRGG